MTAAQSRVSFGNRQARALCNMSHSARLEFLAEGLPIILASSRSFWEAAKALSHHPRERAVLEGFAEEEAAKALILVDVVRCPPKEIDARLGRIIKKIFYSHLARLIYAAAQSWKPMNTAQLQEYIDSERKGHYLEGGMSEFIMPNWSLYRRESTMYADIEVHEGGSPQWGDPTNWANHAISTQPVALGILEALSAIGLFTRAGLQAVCDTWGNVDFTDQEGPTEARELTRELAERIDAEGLATDAANDVHARTFYHHWQIPMYNLDFDMIDVPLEDLLAAREAAYWNEVGYEYYSEY